MPSEIRDSGRQQLGDVPAGIDDYVTGLDPGVALHLRTSHATYYIHQRNNKYHVYCVGRGGGLFDERTLGEAGVRRFLRSMARPSVEVRRGPVDDVLPGRVER